MRRKGSRNIYDSNKGIRRLYNEKAESWAAKEDWRSRQDDDDEQEETP